MSAYAWYVCTNPACVEYQVYKEDNISGLPGAPAIPDVTCGRCRLVTEKRLEPPP